MAAGLKPTQFEKDFCIQIFLFPIHYPVGLAKILWMCHFETDMQSIEMSIKLYLLNQTECIILHGNIFFRRFTMPIIQCQQPVDKL